MISDEDPGPAVQRILLGGLLRDAREAAGLTPTVATKRLRWYGGKVSKVEGGDLKVDDKDLGAMIRAYQIPDDQAQSLRDLARESRRKLPPSRVPGWAAKYVHLERSAAVISVYFPDVFPGMVQTGDYARAILSASVTVAPAEVDRMAEERAQRAAQIATLTHRRVILIIGEEAVHREVGGRDVLRGQLEQIRELAQLPHVTVQIIPFSGGAHASHGVAFTMVRLFDDRPDVTYTEAHTGSDYLGKEGSRVYSIVFDTLRASAMSCQDTINLLTRRIKELT
jgi:hypothetical protein